MQLGRYRKLYASLGGTLTKMVALAASLGAVLEGLTAEQMTAIEQIENSLGIPGGIQGGVVGVIGVLGIVQAVFVYWAPNDP